MTENKWSGPKIIWFLWFQGKEQMPDLVRHCFDSWQRHHPDWEIVFLSDKNLARYLDIQDIIEEREIALYPAAKSDVIRINLLKRYGGVWVDATTFCMQPLDDWLPEKMNTGFFAFNRPGKDRMLSSWFLAAEENHLLIENYAERVNTFWRKHPSLRGWTDRPWIHWFLLRFKVHGFLKKRPTLWFHPFVVDVLKIYPYFWFFYLFEKLYREEEEVKQIWDATPKISADGPHKLWNYGLFKKLSSALREDIDEGRDPLYKLTYKYKPQQLQPGCALHYLLKQYVS